jgi:acyl-CoA thioester hydrolase
MPRPPEHLLDPANYAYGIEVPTRFDDIDSLNHINNVAMAAIFQEGRVRFAHWLREGTVDQDIGTFIVSAHLEYLDQTYYPAPVTVMMAVESVGGSSKTLVQLAIQGGQPKAFCRAVDVHTARGPASAISEEWRVRLAEAFLKGA